MTLNHHTYNHERGVGLDIENHTERCREKHLMRLNHSFFSQGLALLSENLMNIQKASIFVQFGKI